MNSRNMIKIFVLLIVCLIVSSQFACAEGIKERMLKRLPAIKALKTQGIIGENNQGYLGFVTEKRVQEEVVSAQNKDRKTVYSFLVKQENTSIDVVEKRLAKRKAKTTKPGHFFQNDKGEWIKK